MEDTDGECLEHGQRGMHLHHELILSPLSEVHYWSRRSHRDNNKVVQDRDVEDFVAKHFTYPIPHIMAF